MREFNLVKNPEFKNENGRIEGWSFHSPRVELMPEIFFSEDEGIGGLGIRSKGDIHSFGCWRGTAQLKSGEWYKASVRVRINGISEPSLSVAAHFAGHFLDVKSKWGKDNILEQIFWHRNEEKESKVELFLRSATSGSVEWFDPEIVRISKPCFKTARVASVRFGEPKHGGKHSIKLQRERIQEKLELAGALRPDLVLLPEFSQIIGVPEEIYGSYHEAAQAVPEGPLCRTLKNAAVKFGMYVIAGMIEKRKDYMFNTAVIFDRTGNFLGQYDKTHLTFGEFAKGFSCGLDYPVFDLDFGRIGIHICYDEWFPEVSRYYAYKGVKMLLLPVAGGKPITWRTRAIDNGIYFISSSINPPSMIISSSGEILSEIHTDGLAVADLNLDYRETNWYKDPTLVCGMPGINEQMRNTADNRLLFDIYERDC